MNANQDIIKEWDALDTFGTPLILYCKIINLLGKSLQSDIKKMFKASNFKSISKDNPKFKRVI